MNVTRQCALCCLYIPLTLYLLLTAPIRAEAKLEIISTETVPPFWTVCVLGTMLLDIADALFATAIHSNENII